jgi:DNA-binding NarL/FixJ family response regulator
MKKCSKKFLLALIVRRKKLMGTIGGRDIHEERVEKLSIQHEGIHLCLANGQAWRKDGHFMGREVLIAESSEILRAGLQAVLMSDKYVVRIHEAATKEELYTQLHSKSLDMIVVNQSFITDNISILPRGRFVILTAALDRDFFQRAYKHGARGYLLESTSAELLRAALYLEEGSFLIDPALTTSILEYFSSSLRFPTQDHLLSPKEKEVISLLREGIDRKNIAQKLHISDTTLKTHIKHIRRKTMLTQSNKIEAKISDPERKGEEEVFYPHPVISSSLPPKNPP